MVAFRITLVAALLALAAAAGLPGRRSRLFGTRIVGGESADIQDFPYQVSLYYYNHHFCAASVISDKFALTTARCLSDGVNPGTGYIRAGSSRHVDGERYYLASVKVHDKYNKFGTIDYDLGLLEVTKAFQFGPTIQPIALPEANEIVPDRSEAVLAGWGRTSFVGPDADVLQKADLFIVSQSYCNGSYYNIYGEITDRMICAAAEGKDVCFGDSGSPLVVKNKLVGMVSWGTGWCNPGDIEVFTRVSDPELRKFIKDNANV